LEAEVVRENAEPHETGKTAAEDAERDEKSRTARSRRPGVTRRSGHGCVTPDGALRLRSLTFSGKLRRTALPEARALRLSARLAVSRRLPAQSTSSSGAATPSVPLDFCIK